MKKPLIYLLTFIFIILSSRASVFANSWGGLRFMTLITFIIFLFRKEKFSKEFFVITAAYTGIVIVQQLKFGNAINTLSSINYFNVILYAYLTIKIFKQRFFFYFEKIVYQLSYLSIPLYILQLLFKPLLFSINKSLEFFGGSDSGSLYSNSLLFTFRDPHWTRNCGFMWEPGGFGAILTIAILLNIIYNNFRFNKHLVIFVIADLTTLSTTAYVNLIFLFMFFYFNCKYKNKVLILIPVVLIACVSLFQFSFLADKIDHQITNATAEKGELQGEYAKNQNVLVFGRFSSLLIDIDMVKDSYVIGRGFQDVIVKNYTLNLSNGLGDYYLHFGLVGIVFLMLGYYYTLKGILYKFAYKNIFFAFVSMLAIGFSNPMLSTPIMVLFQFYFLFNKGFGAINKYTLENKGVFNI